MNYAKAKLPYVFVRMSFLLLAFLLQGCNDPRQDNEIYRLLKPGQEFVEVGLRDLLGSSWDAVCILVPGADPRRVLSQGGKWFAEQARNIPETDEFGEYLWKVVLFSRSLPPRVLELHKQDFNFSHEECLEAGETQFSFCKDRNGPPKRENEFQHYSVVLKQVRQTGG